jgi:hypothetical protein
MCRGARASTDRQTQTERECGERGSDFRADFKIDVCASSEARDAETRLKAVGLARSGKSPLRIEAVRHFVS